jgi:hypothetical protein
VRLQTFELLAQVMIKYDCDSAAEAIKNSDDVFLEKDVSELAQTLAELLND